MFPFQIKMSFLFIFVAASATMTIVTGAPNPPSETADDGTFYLYGGENGNGATAVRTVIDGVVIKNDTAKGNTVLINQGADKVPESFITGAMENTMNIFAMATTEDQEENYSEALKLYFQGMGYALALKTAISQSSRSQQEADEFAALVDQKCAQFKERSDYILYYYEFIRKKVMKHGMDWSGEAEGDGVSPTTEAGLKGEFEFLDLKPQPTPKPTEFDFGSLLSESILEKTN